ncbi:hypothetical protein ILYODFUR_019801 [Ilyodon furcidens]|uniref:Uncharacterized protein n=1 Tax=Ilyodon furcidens TaxID=33524 RepID=A0ABV0TP39_9TELE
MSYTHLDSPYILYTPRSRCRYPIGTTSPQTQEVVPFPSGVETVRPPQHLNPGSCLNLSDPVPDPDPPPRLQSPTTPILIRRWVMYKRGVYMVQTSPPTRAATE